MKSSFLIFCLAWIVGCASKPTVQTLRFYEQATGSLPADYARQVTIPITGQQLAINPQPTLTERDVLAAKLTPTPGGDAVLLKFDAHGANLLSEMTTRLRGQSLVVMVNDKPVATLLVDRPNVTGQLLLLGDLTDQQTKALVDSLNNPDAKKSTDEKPKPE